MVVACDSKVEERIVEVPIPQIPDGFEPVEPVPIDPGASFIGFTVLEDQMILDLQNIPSNAQRQDSRYLVGCNRFNQGDDLTLFEQGVNKGINGISTEPQLERVRAIGVGDCIYRVRLSDYGITPREWARIEECLLLPLRISSVRNDAIRFLTQSRIPWVFAEDFFTFVANGDAVIDSRDRAGITRNCSLIYYDLKEAPNNLDDFFVTRGVDVQGEYDDEEAVLQGFSQSGIALGKSRGVQFLQSTFGWCMSTFDSALGGDDMFVNPFPIEAVIAGDGVQISDRVYQFDAMETICANPNSLYEDFYLNGAAKLAEFEAPNDVVNQQNPIDPTIRLRDCSRCHHDAAIEFTDQLGSHIANNPAFNLDERTRGAIFFSAIRAQAIMQEIDDQHNDALRKLGITAENDPVNEVLVDPFRNEMSASQIASFFLMPEQEFLRRLRASAISSVTFGNLLTGGRVSLAILSLNFITLSLEIQAYEDIEL